VREGLADGTIDIVATDHAPHPVEAKDCEWAAAAFGMVGLESALSVVQASVVDTGMLDWADVARVFSRAPAAIGQLDGYDRGIAVGAPASFTLYDPSVSRVFETTQLRGKGINSPYLSTTLPGRVVTTVHRGHATVLDGELVDAETVAAAARAHDQAGADHG